MISKKYIFEEIKKSIKQNIGLHFSSLLILTATFTVIFSMLSVVSNLKTILSQWGKDIQITVFLDEDLSQESLESLKSKISEIESFKTVVYSDKAKAKEKFIASMPGLTRDLLEDPEFSNPFPASLQIGGLQQTAVERIPKIAASIARLTGVEDVSYGQEWVENYAGFLGGLSRGGLLIVITLFLGSLMITSNAVRVALAQKREHIEILELVGATKKMIRAPFLVEGALMGFVAAVMALGMSYLIHLVEVNLLTTEMSFLGVSEIFRFFGPLQLIGLSLFGAFAGLSGAYLCVKRINTGWAASGAHQ